MILDRYIMREIIKPTVAVCVILIFIFGCYMATRFLGDALVGQLSGKTVILLILLRIVIALEVLLPTTLYLSVVVALGRMHKDFEMIALFACGVGIGRVLRPVLYPALIIAAIVASLTLFIRPLAYDWYYRLEDQALVNFDLTRMNDETFYETANGTRIIYAEKVDHQRDKAKRVFIRTEREGMLQVIYAGKAKQSVDPASGKKFLVFSDGYLYEFSRTGDDGRVFIWKITCPTGKKPALAAGKETATTRSSGAGPTIFLETYQEHLFQPISWPRHLNCNKRQKSLRPW